MEVPSIAGYVLREVAGTGGTGTVWRALHVAREQDVAIKSIERLHGATTKLDLLEREVEVLARTDHPGIIRLLDAGRDDRAAPFIAMEWVDGGTLARHDVETWAEARRILVALLEALAHAHARGVLHRDIKRSNVLLERRASELVPRLGDFGISALTGARPGGRFGTPAYMAPEQLEGSGLDEGPWTDLYGLGCLAYELVSGARPFVAESVAQLFELHRRAPRPLLRPRIEVPPGLSDWITRLIAARWQERFTSAGEARLALEALDPSPTAPDLGPAPVSLVTRGPPLGARLMGRTEPSLLGRHREAEWLWDEAKRVLADGHARLVHVRGPEGVGKSRLARWLSESLEPRGFVALVIDGDDPRGVARALCRAFHVDSRTSPVGPLLERLSLIGVSPDSYGARAVRQIVSGGPERSSAAWSLRTLVREISVRRPTLVWLDGLDGPGAAWMGALRELRRYGEVRALLVLAGDAEPVGDGEVDRRLSLERLDDPSMTRLLRTVAPLSAESLREIVEESDGLPGRALTTLRQLLHSGAIRSEGQLLHIDRTRVRDASALEQLVDRRLRKTASRPRHGPALRDALLALGARGPAAPSRADVSSVLHALGHAGEPDWWEMLVLDGWLDPDAGDEARFRSRVDQEALDRLATATGEIARLHRAWLAAMPDDPDEAKASHALGAGALEASVEALERAAERARETGLGGLVARVARRCIAALTGPEDDALRARAWAVLAAAAFASGDVAGGESAIGPLRTLGAPGTEWRLLWLESVHHQLCGQVEEARDGFTRAVAGAPSLLARGRCFHGVAECAKLVNDLDDAEVAYRDAEHAFREQGNSHALGRALAGLGDTLRRKGRFEEARRVLDESMLVLEGATLGEGIVANTRGDVERAAGDLDAAVSWYELALDKVVSGASQDAAFVYLNLGLTHLAAGDFGRAHEATSRARSLFRAAGRSAYEAHVDAIDLAVALARGARERAAELRARLEERLVGRWREESDLAWLLARCDELEATASARAVSLDPAPPATTLDIVPDDA